jgi:hypothetical protein
MFLNVLSFVTPGEKPEGSMAARVVGAALEPCAFSPGVTKGELCGYLYKGHFTLN